MFSSLSSIKGVGIVVPYIILTLAVFAVDRSLGQAPGGVSDSLKLWLKADAGVTGSNPVTAWADQSGSSPDAIKVGTAPDLENDQLNFNPVLNFDGNNDYLQITGGLLGNSTVNDVWIYSVYKQDLLGNNRTLLYEQTSNGRLAIIPTTFSSTRINVGNGSYNTGSGANTVDYNIWTHASSTSTSTPSGDRKSISRDGGYLGGGSTNNTFLTGNGSNFLIGAGWDNGNGTSNNLDGQVAELIVYDGIPSALEQEKVQSYLALKYGITKNSADNVSTVGQDERDYFASDGTTVVWDFVDNMAYHHDVTGIGRDTDTALDQRKSKSSNSQGIVTLDKGGAFPFDKDFIVWGNNDVTGRSTDVIAGYDVRTSKVWKVAVTGSPGNVSFSIDLRGLGFELLNSTAADFALLIDDDGTFAPNAVAHTNGASLSNGILSFTNVGFTDGDFFAVAGPILMAAPGAVNFNLALWLKADTGVTGANPVTAWADQSGSSPDAIKVGTAPDLENDQLNFNPVLNFDGSNDYLQITGGLLGNSTVQDIWIYSVYKQDLLGNNRTLLYEQTSNGRLAIIPTTFSSTRINVGNGSYNTGSGANTVDYNIWTHASSTSTSTPSGDRKSISRDGGYLGAGSTTNTFLGGRGSNFLIGGGWDNGNGTSNNLDGQVAELIVYTGIPSALEQEKVQSYLALKYGITKNSADNGSTGGQDERDYFASDGSTIVWNYSDNFVYHNDVAGIGRDDSTALDQRKSRSSNYQTAVTLDKGGSFSFDKDFIVWGHDATTGCSSDVVAGYDGRTTRVWKVAVTGTPGNVNFSVDLTGLGFDLQGSVAADFALLIDDDGTFAPNAVAHTTGASLTNSTLSFTDVSFADGDFFAIAGPSIASAPGAVKLNLALWLKADAGVTGSTPVTAWADQSGSSPDAVQVGTAPDLVADQLNFNPVLNFDGNNDYLQITGGLLGSNTYNDIWIYSVYKQDVLGNNRSLLYERTSNGRLAIIPTTFSSTRINVGNGSYNTGSGANILDYNMWTHASSTSTSTPSGDRKSISRDGGYLGGGSTTNTFLTGNGSNFLIGGGWDNGNGTSNNLDGQVAELIVYAGVPSALEQEKVQSYLALKYGITKNSADNGSTGGQDERDYFASDGTTVVWDYSANEVYHHDVTGIGRDDDTSLDQRKSKSSNSQGIVTLDKGGAFSSDKDFIIWGNDDEIGCSSDIIAGYDVRTTRVWKVAVTGTPGNVSFSVDLTGLGFDLQGGAISDFALLIDDNGTFAPNAVAHTNGASLTNGVLSFTNVSFTDGDFFAIAGPSSVAAPGGVKLNLALWLKADAGVTGTSPVTAWTDQSGSSPDAVQVGTAPDLVTDQLNYNPVLDFDGNNDYLQITGGLLGTNTYNDMWIYSVYKQDVLGNNRSLLYERTSNGRLAITPYSFNTARINFGNGSYNTGSSSNTVDYNVWTYASSTSTSTPSGDRKSISKDGLYLGAGSTSNTTVTGIGANFLIGAGWDNGVGTSSNFDGKIAEVIVYTGIPTLLEQEKIQTYLALKYGIPKNSVDDPGTVGQDERDYFASDGTTVIWDFSADAGFNNEIMAIGRDDQTAFLQKQTTTTDDSLLVFVGALAANNQANSGTISNDVSYLVIGNDQGALRSAVANGNEKPVGIYSRFGREWKITNTNFSNSFSLEIEWDSVGPFSIDSVRLLVDEDGDFTNATVFDASSGLTFTNGSIIISGINTTHIPLNTTRFITIGSVDVIGGPLPIDLLSFSALPQDETRVDLQWKTASETNNDFFTIERSRDAQHWESVQVVPGQGNSSTIREYQAHDLEPYDGQSYYRLKQTDFDGQYTYSQVEAVSIQSLTNANIRIYPNPTKQDVIIEGIESNIQQVVISNALGTNVTHLTSSTPISDTSVRLDLSSLKPGIYYVKAGPHSSRINKL